VLPARGLRFASRLSLRRLRNISPNPTTRAALSGMLTAKVDREWAGRHYPRWKP